MICLAPAVLPFWCLSPSCTSSNGRALQVQVCEDVGPRNSKTHWRHLFTPTDSLPVKGILIICLQGKFFKWLSSIWHAWFVCRGKFGEFFHRAVVTGFSEFSDIDMEVKGLSLVNMLSIYLSGPGYAHRWKSSAVGAQWWKLLFPSCQHLKHTHWLPKFINIFSKVNILPKKWHFLITMQM